MKPKEYLLSIGAISEITRGRMSKEHDEMIRAAVAANPNLNIQGYTATSTPATVEKPADIKVTKAKASAEKIVESFTILWDEKLYRAVEWFDGKKVIHTMRAVCNNCRTSLVQCGCGAPTIISYDGRGTVSVTIEKV